ncbi:hypothetical protein [Glycomyces buryatensis]|uniref:Uncharacterized protein n=1 Tax=Glycomyces buryatensis TaxID=2570927 RepID=A0A4V4HSE7_9ACTN|nr:hypothetical protein [Glycomyces buryatensis]THV41426.1 hypothetical protein FAB82_11550 [Glycomyces buryatensis]
MSNGFGVVPGDLSGASTALKALAGTADCSQQVSNGGRTTGAANVGYMTTQAINNFTMCFKEVGEAMENRLNDHAEALAECAQTYGDTDDDVANPFNTYLSDL